MTTAAPEKLLSMKASAPDNDEALLRLMQAGDEAAFVELYRRRQGGVYRFALQMCGAASVAEDVTQEVFMVLMREADRFDPARGNIAAYLYGIARKQVLRRLAKDRAYVALTDDAADEGVASVSEALRAADDPLSVLTRGELIATVREAVLALPAHYREVVVLCELHELSYAEAARALGCAVGTVRSRLYRARALLSERLRTVHQDGTAAAPVKATRCFA